ncbi:PAS domain-containing protein [Roseomonas aerophila]|uniref:histidine kinase n=1 Tax=Teichococcus aerophilus TaxID=1224513 RepID=A0ABR7RQN8_9PROT|nr:PAS domain-containing protein [Pseudoroseomonas aerophila]
MPVSKPWDDATRAERTASDAERIGAEILGIDSGTDPFVAAVRATRMPMIITDPRQHDNPVVFTNDAFCRLTGYSRQEILGHNCRFLQGEETDPETVRRIREAVAAARSIEIDIRNHRKNGEPFWNRLLLAPVRDAEGRLAYFFASQVDVTLERDRMAGLESRNAALLAELGDRLRAQEDSESRLRFATQAGRLGIWELDLVSGELVTSSICREIFGRDPNAPFSFAELQAAIHPDDSARMAAAVERSVRTGEDYQLDYRVLREDGRIGWVQIRAQVSLRPDGTPGLMAGTSLDITQRKEAELRTQALLELDDRFRLLESPGDLAYAAAEVLGKALHVSRAGYGSVDPQAETITVERDWNAPGIKTIAGTLNFRDHGSYIEDLKRGETAIVTNAETDPRTAATAATLKAISAWSFINMPVTEHDGLVALLYLNHDRPREWPAEELTFIREVANRTRMAVERRRAEKDLEGLAATLERQVEARTSELRASEAQLRQAQKMEAVGQLTGGIAHDFNNLLTGVIGSLELLEARVAQGRANEVGRFVSAAKGAAERAAALTHRLLAFSRQQTLDPRPTDLNRLVAGMEELIRRTTGPEISVEVVGSSGLWSTLVDAGQVENALLNLAINGRDAMPEGGRLTIETANRWLDEAAARERELPIGQYVSLCVSDTGTGMPPDVVAKAFDPFFTTKPIGQGTGLGLSMIYGFARQSGGQVRIYSEVGQGTTVCLYLPRHAGPVAEAQAPGQQADMRKARFGETVLVVDDEPTVRMLVTDVLEDLGYNALEAEDGPSGLEILRSDQRIDLLVSDVGLPGGMNGRQLADAARLLRPGLKVLFITGYAENAMLGQGHFGPGMHVLSKPFPVEILARRIQEMLGRRDGDAG